MKLIHGMRLHSLTASPDRALGSLISHLLVRRIIDSILSELHHCPSVHALEDLSCSTSELNPRRKLYPPHGAPILRGDNTGNCSGIAILAVDTRVWLTQVDFVE